MTKEDWIIKCAARFIACGGMGNEAAQDAATVCWDACVEFDGEAATLRDMPPEEAADEDMSCWTDA